MTKIAWSAILGIVLIVSLLLLVAPAEAQATRSWVSGVGDDANNCSRTTPCKTFRGAITKTADGGIINCLDSSGFGFVTITKSITIDCGGTFGGIVAATTNGVNVDADGVIVTLRNLSIDGVGTGQIGVNFVNGRVLHIENCKIWGFRAGSAVGINFAPPAGVTGELYVSDSAITDSGNAGTNGGIVIRPVGTGTAKVMLERVQVKNNTSGIRVDSTAQTANGLSVSVSESISAGNTNEGVAAIAPTIAINLMLDRVRIAHNGTGLLSSAAPARIRVGGSTITGNLAGIRTTGSIRSYQTNQINGNAAAEPTLPTVALK
jgi:hypothetical protein